MDYMFFQHFCYLDVGLLELFLHVLSCHKFLGMLLSCCCFSVSFIVGKDGNCLGCGQPAEHLGGGVILSVFLSGLPVSVDVAVPCRSDGLGKRVAISGVIT